MIFLFCCLFGYTFLFGCLHFFLLFYCLWCFNVLVFDSFVFFVVWLIILCHFWCLLPFIFSLVFGFLNILLWCLTPFTFLILVLFLCFGSFYFLWCLIFLIYLFGVFDSLYFYGNWPNIPFFKLDSFYFLSRLIPYTSCYGTFVFYCNFAASYSQQHFYPRQALPPLAAIGHRARVFSMDGFCRARASVQAREEPVRIRKCKVQTGREEPMRFNKGISYFNGRFERLLQQVFFFSLFYFVWFNFTQTRTHGTYFRLFSIWLCFFFILLCFLLCFFSSFYFVFSFLFFYILACSLFYFFSLFYFVS